MLKTCLPDNAFYGRGPQLGPQVILTDNCKEERNVLRAVWSTAILLLFTFQIQKQFWRWLHEKSDGINENDCPYIPNLFKRCLYAETKERFEECYNELFNDGLCLHYEILIKYLRSLYYERKAFALCFRTKLPVRGNHTSKFVEAQFLVLKDKILRRIK